MKSKRPTFKLRKRATAYEIVYTITKSCNPTWTEEELLTYMDEFLVRAREAEKEGKLERKKKEKNKG